ncbi:MAG: hypothetical protein K2Y22_17620 [Candidatus Obscuribacterales bacterium]|nr:hypothetical protein [Candidatus Obscuribacterales bacterium]
MGDNSPMRLGDFRLLVHKWDCRIEKTTKEWEVRDNKDNLRVTGFASVRGREVKRSWVKRFLKLIQEKRASDEQKEEQ